MFINKFFRNLFVSHLKELKLIWMFSIITFVLYMLINNGWQKHPDSYDYTQGIDAIFQNKPWYDPDIALRPGAVYLSLPFAFIFDNVNSVGLHNLVLYFLFGPLFFLYSYRIVPDRQIALYSTLLLITSFPILYWGIAILNDLGGWFFLILSIYMTIKLNDNNFPIRQLVYSALILGFAVIYKPTVLPAAVFFTLVILWQYFKNYEITFLKIWIFFTIISMLPLLINSFIIYEIWGYDFYNDLFVKEIFGKEEEPGQPSLSPVFKDTYLYKFYTVIIAFPLIPLAFLGFYEIKLRISEKELTYLLLIFISCFSMVLFLVFHSPRYTFLVFPVMYIFIGQGFITFGELIQNKLGVRKEIFFFSVIFLNLLLSIIICTNDNFFREIAGIWQNE